MLNKNIIKKSTLLLSFLSLLSVATIAQNNYLKIYHGMGNETRIFQGKTTQFDGTWNEDIKIIKAKESLITIEIINPNPFFYKYEIKTEDFDIKDNFPDLSELLSAINAIKDLSSSQSSNSGNRSALLNDNPSNGLKKYQDILADLYDNINSAKNFLLRSDPPESIQEALGYTGTNGFRGAIKNIEDLPGGKPNEKGLFNSESLQKDLDSFLGAAENDGTLFTGITNNDIKKGYKEAFELLNKQLTATVDEIKKTIKTENRVLIFTVSVKDKGTKIKLVITKKDSRAKRMEIDQTIAMIYPEPVVRHRP